MCERQCGREGLKFYDVVASVMVEHDGTPHTTNFVKIATPQLKNEPEVSGFAPHFIFGHFWAALSKMSGFHPTQFFGQFWADPIFQLFEALFWPKRRPKILNFNPTRKFGHFWAQLEKKGSGQNCRKNRVG